MKIGSIVVMSTIVLTGVYSFSHNRIRKEASLRVTSSSFKDGQLLPKKYTQFAVDEDSPIQNYSPQLSWSGAPYSTKSFVIIVDDPDAPSGNWTHWVIFNIPAIYSGIDEHGTIDGAVEGATSWGTLGYKGPLPPKGSLHRYRFTVYALDSMLQLPPGSTQQQVEKSMRNKIVARGTLVGVFGIG